MKPLLTLVFACCIAAGNAQTKKPDPGSKKNYVLEINGDSVSLSLDEPVSIKTPDGQTLNLKLKQKQRLNFEDDILSFQYTPAFTVTVKKFEDIEQILCISASGNSILIQKYKDTNPETMSEFMLGEITQESRDAGYKETKTDVRKTLKSGKLLKGKQSKLVLDDETNIYAVYPVKMNNDGLMIVMIIVDPADDKEMKAMEVFWKSFETKKRPL